MILTPMAFTLDKDGKKTRDYTSFLRDFWGTLCADDSTESKEEALAKSFGINEITWADLDFAVSILHALSDVGATHEQAGRYVISNPHDAHSSLFLGNYSSAHAVRIIDDTGRSVFNDHTKGSEELDSFLEELFCVLKDDDADIVSKERIVAASAQEADLSQEDTDFAFAVLWAADNAGVKYRLSTGEVISSAPGNIVSGANTSSADNNQGTTTQVKKKPLPLLDPEVVLSRTESRTVAGAERIIIFGGAAAELDETTDVDTEDIVDTEGIVDAESAAGTESRTNTGYDHQDGDTESFFGTANMRGENRTLPRKPSAVSEFFADTAENAPSEREVSRILWAVSAAALVGGAVWLMRRIARG